MKTPTEILEPPPAIGRLPRDRRGYPIPVIVSYIDGAPDFTVSDDELVQRVLARKLCGICGERMGGNKAFIGGPNSMVYRQFTDPPMHLVCATYAMRVCPYIALSRTHHKRVADVRIVGDRALVKNPMMADEKPDFFGLAVTKTYTYGRAGAHLCIEAGEWVSLSWWREGVEIDVPDDMQDHIDRTAKVPIGWVDTRLAKLWLLPKNARIVPR